MSVTIISEVPATASGSTTLTHGTITLSTPGSEGSSGVTIPISSVINLTENLNSKLNDTLGPIGISNVLVNGADINLLSGLAAYGGVIADFQKLADITVSAAELNHTSGLTNNIQDQLDEVYTDADFTSAGQIIYSTATGTSQVASLADVLNGTIGTGFEMSALKAPTASLSMNTQRITSLATPVGSNDAATKGYVDAQIVQGGGYLALEGGVMSGTIEMSGNIIILDADGDTSIGSTIDDTVVINIAGAAYTWTAAGLNMGSSKISNVINPTGAQDAATKNYVDTSALRVSGGNGMAGTLDLNGFALILDSDADTTIKADVDDVITISIGGISPVNYSITSSGLSMASKKVSDVADPTLAQDAATKNYVDSTAVLTDGSNAMTGGLDLGGYTLSNPLDPTLGIHVGDRDYNDARYLKVASNLSDLADVAASRVSLGLKTVAATGSYNDLLNKPTIISTLNGLTDVSVGTPGALQDGHVLSWSNGAGEFTLSPRSVSTVFGRTGEITAQAGDYTASDITNVAGGRIAATNVQTALNELDGDKLARDGSQAMIGSLNMGSNTITNLAAPLTLGQTTINATGIISTQGGIAPSIKTTSNPTAADPTYSFVGFSDAGMWYNDGAVRIAVGGADHLTVSTTAVDAKSKKVVNVSAPTADGDAVNLGYLKGLSTERVLGSVTGLDLLAAVAGSTTAVYSVPAGKRHVITKIIVVSTSYTPGVDPTNAIISVGTAASSYDQLVSDTVLSWGPNGASNQAIILDPIPGAIAPNAGETFTVQVDTPASGTFTSLVVNIYFVGFEL